MWFAKPNSSNANQIIENLISNGIIESRERERERGGVKIQRTEIPGIK